MILPIIYRKIVVVFFFWICWDWCSLWSIRFWLHCRYEAGQSTMTVASSTPLVKSSQLLKIPHGISDISSGESGKQATDRLVDQNLWYMYFLKIIYRLSITNTYTCDMTVFINWSTGQYCKCILFIKYKMCLCTMQDTTNQ